MAEPKTNWGSDDYNRPRGTAKGSGAGASWKARLDAQGITLTRDDTSGKTYVAAPESLDGKRTGQPVRVIIAGTSPSGALNVQSLENALISVKNATKPTDVNRLKAQLASLGYYSSDKAYEESLRRQGWDADTDKALAAALDDISIQNYDAIVKSPNKDPKVLDLSTYLTRAGSGTGVGGPTTTTYFTKLTSKQASDLIRDTMVEMIGRPPTNKEVADFTKSVNEALKKSPGRTTVSGTSQTSTQGLDAGQFAAEYVLSKVVEPKLKQDPNAEFGGQIGEVRSNLKTYASNMGLAVSDRDITSRVMKVAGKQSTLKDQTADMRKFAMDLYKPFAKRLQEDENITVRDLANPYLRLMADTLELDENNISLTDDTILKAINGGPDGQTLTSLWEFRKTLRKDPRFDFTLQARQEATNVAQGLLQAFGYGV